MEDVDKEEFPEIDSLSQSSQETAEVHEIVDTVYRKLEGNKPDTNLLEITLCSVLKAFRSNEIVGEDQKDEMKLCEFLKKIESEFSPIVD